MRDCVLTLVEATPERVVGTVVFLTRFAGVQGHFPGNPIVPGFCQVEACRELATLARGTRLEVAGIEEGKLTRALRPGEEARMELAWEGECVEAVLEVGGERVARYLLRLKPA